MVENKKIESDIKEKLVAINRITKVVKGGRRFGFAALVVVGNQKGSVGIGQGKSKQVPDAIKKATEVAKRNLIKIPLKEGRTLHHDVNGKNGSGKVFLRAAPAGTGIIAGQSRIAFVKTTGRRRFICCCKNTSSDGSKRRETIVSDARPIRGGRGSCAPCTASF